MDAIVVCERYYAALRDRDLNGAIATLALDCKAEAPGASLANRDAIEAWIGGFFSAFPDISHETQKLELAGETVLVDLHLHGTHTRPLVTPQGAIPATNRSIAFDAKNKLQVRGGKIINLHIAFDAADFMRQLGV